MRIPKWKAYQIETAEFFQKLGLNTIIEHKVEGVRGLHEVDVFVEGDIHGLPFVWVIECKAWNSNVPKEKVLALTSIITDIGADRGFLLSEKGFQSGAIRIAEKSNITLTSIRDLNQTIQIDSIIGQLSWRLQKASLRLRKFKKEYFNDEYFPPMMKELGDLHILDSVLVDALDNNYPFIYQANIKVHSLEELTKMADEVLTRAENWKP